MDVRHTPRLASQTLKESSSPMSLEQVFLAFAAMASGIASGAIRELVGARWCLAWLAAMLVALMGLYVT